MAEKRCHIERFIGRLFQRDPGFVTAVFNEFMLDDYTVRDMGLEASVNYRRLIKLLERCHARGILVYGHVSPTGRFVLMDINDIWNAVCVTLAKAYAEEQE